MKRIRKTGAALALCLLISAAVAGCGRRTQQGVPDDMIVTVPVTENVTPAEVPSAVAEPTATPAEQPKPTEEVTPTDEPTAMPEVTPTDEPTGTSAVTPAVNGARRILVIETTDIHGYLLDASSGEESTFEYRLAYIAKEADRARKSGEYDDVILLDGGDIYQGTPVSAMTEGAALRAAMESIRYDAVCLGNHEFDWDVTECAADASATMAAYRMGEYEGDPDIPVVASDLYDAATRQRVDFTKDYVILEKAGKRIAVVGYLPDYSASVMAAKIAPYRIKADTAKLAELIGKVRETEHPDALIVLVHGRPKQLAEELNPEDVNLVAGGHTHEIQAKTAENGIAYIQANCYAAGYASAVLCFDEAGAVKVEDVSYHDITEDPSKLYDTPENTASFDEDVLAISRAAWAAVNGEMSEVLGYIDTPIRKKSVDDSPTTVAGNWVTGLMLEATRQYGAVAAFYNNGGIRKNLTLAKGEKKRPVTVYDIYTMAPFSNRLLIYELSGPELAQQIVNGLRTSNYGDQMSGLTFTYTVGGEPDATRRTKVYTVCSVTLSDGTEVDLTDGTKTYRVCVGDFNATQSGSVFSGKTPVIPEADSPAENESMIAALRREAAANDGLIPVDTSPRGTIVPAQETPEGEDPEAA